MLDVSLFCLLLSVTTAHVVTPEQFGAVGDGKANDWAAIQKTMAACTNQTYCRIDFVNTYLTGPVVVSTSNTTLNITGNVFMLPKSTYDYPSGGSFKFL